MQNARSIYLQLLDHLRTNLRNAQFVDSAYGTELSNTQARILDEWNRAPSATFETLGRLLGLDRTTVSRSISKLVQKGYLTYGRSKADQRRKRVAITKKGQDFIALQIEFTDKQVRLQSHRLNSPEALELASYLKEFADGSGAHQLHKLPGENDITIQFRRLTYAHGVISDNYLNSNQSAATWLILSEIEYRKTQARQLEKVLHIPQSTLSVRLKKLHLLGLISNQYNSNDKREKIIKLTKSGKLQLRAIEHKAEVSFKLALKQLPSWHVQRFTLLLGKYVGEDLQVNEIYLGEELTMRACKDEKLLESLRWKAIKNLAQLSPDYPLGSTLFSSENEVFAINQNGENIGGVELSRISKNYYLAINFFIDREIPISFTLEELKNTLSNFLPKQTIDFSKFPRLK